MQWPGTNANIATSYGKGDTASLCSRREVREVADRRGAIGERYCLQLWALVWFGVGAKMWEWRGGAV